MRIFPHLFEKMVSAKHLFLCWDYFKRGKNKKEEIVCFERHLEDHIFQLEEELQTFTYKHAPYTYFTVCDPKERNISKACVRDRLVHQMLHSVLTYVFDKTFIFHSLSSRLGKGTHLGLFYLKKMIKKVSLNGKKPCYALKMDIRRFFDTINHDILKALIRKTIKDEKVLKIVDIVIDSFKTKKRPFEPIGVPLGNVTSQIFANIYLHELDFFVKNMLKQRYYLRYSDDFIILSDDEKSLRDCLGPIQTFLQVHLKLELHPRKISLRKLSQGIDFLGYVVFMKYSILRVRTKHRLKRRLQKAHKRYLKEEISADSMDQRLQSYLGILSHANQNDLSQTLQNAYSTREFP